MLATTRETPHYSFDSLDAALPFLEDEEALSAAVYDAPNGVLRVQIGNSIWKIDERQLNEFLISERGFTKNF